jgi:sugar phosphate isomerase/epimerase
MVFNRPRGRKASIEDCIRLCAEAGYTVMDMNFHDCAVFETPLWHDSWESWIHGIDETARRYGVEFSQAHSHFYSYCQKNIPGRDVYDEKIRRGIIGAGILGVKWTVIHADTDFASATLVKSSKEKSLEYFKPLLELAARYHVGIAIENLWELNISPLRRYTVTAEELCDLVDSLPFDNVGICWDVEHADIMKQDQHTALGLVGERLKATHISDNRGAAADHILPFMGNTDWPEVMRALRDVRYEGDFSYEVLHYADSAPDELLPSALKHSYEVGRYLLSL